MKILKYIATLFVLTLSSSAFANLLDKVQLEEVLQRRIEKTLIPYDKNIGVRVKFTYKTVTSLPGMTLSENMELVPNIITESDVRGLQIEIRSQLPQMTKEMENDIYDSIPLRKSRIKIKYTSLAPQETNKIPPAPTGKDLWDISKNLTKDFSSLLMTICLISLGVLAMTFFFIYRLMAKNTTNNFALLAKSISDFSPASFSSPTASESKNNAFEKSMSSHQPLSTGLDLPEKGLLELFADCYWCEQDGYAHWLWQQVSSVQKRDLLEKWPLLKKYSQYFIQTPAVARQEHTHPYYIEPETLLSFSQAVLSKEIKKQPDLWLSLSPLRQKNINLPISEKLRLVKKDSAAKMPKILASSQERLLPLSAQFGDLSFQDEQSLLQNPEIVPLEMREQFTSLVWLSLQNKDYIEQVLAKYDAATLASGWIGASEVLQKLEEALPEKKQKLLQSYLAKGNPNRSSPIYQELSALGVKNNAA